MIFNHLHNQSVSNNAKHDGDRFVFKNSMLSEFMYLAVFGTDHIN